MADTSSKLEAYGQMVRDAFLSINTARRGVMVDKIGHLTMQLEEAAKSHFKVLEDDLGRYVSLHTLESLVQQLRAQEEELRLPLVAVGVHNLFEFSGYYHNIPEEKVVGYSTSATNTLATLCSNSFWEALDVTMKRRAAEDLKAWHQEPTFKMLGLGLYDGELVFVYSCVSPEHGLVLYRLPVREEDLPDLPTAATAE